jgi:hypothetical protein
MNSTNPGPSDVILATGGYFNIFEPDHPGNGRIRVQTIGRALANMCRYGGHCPYFSVAEHSVIVSHMVPEEFAAEALMHDAGEAIVGDLRRPLKYMLPQFLDAERTVDEWIGPYFGLRTPWPAEVKEADRAVCWIEQRELFNNTDDWGVPEPTREMWDRLAQAGKHGMVRNLLPDAAFAAFMVRAAELGIRHG